MKIDKSMLPRSPYTVYKNFGWLNWGDWLDNTRVYLPFEEARNLIRDLKLKGMDEWKDWCKSGNRPTTIPSHPHIIYKDSGWISFGDWFGTGYIACSKREYLLFVEAREYIRKLGLKSQKEWLEYTKSGDKPDNIPANPRDVYEDEWISDGDWLGTGYIACSKRKYLSFEDAKIYIYQLGILTQIEYHKWAESTEKPSNIPYKPERTYKDQWISWSDWLGNGRISNQNKEFLPFEEARAIVHNLKINSRAKWREWVKSGNKPHNIPTNPNMVYKNKGWICDGDWYGTNSISNITKHSLFLSFQEAREYVHKLNLKGQKEWSEWAKSNHRPNYITSCPERTYKDNGWVCFADWLGAGRNSVFLSFEESKIFVHTLNLKSAQAWQAYAKSNNKPNNIPSDPYKVYKKQETWKGWKDFLGND